MRPKFTLLTNTAETLFQLSKPAACGWSDALFANAIGENTRMSGTDGRPCAMHVRPAGASDNKPLYVKTEFKAAGFRRPMYMKVHDLRPQRNTALTIEAANGILGEHAKSKIRGA